MALPKELEDNIKGLIKLFGDNNTDIEKKLLDDAEESYNKIIPRIFNKQISNIKEAAKREGELSFSATISSLSYLYKIAPLLKIMPSNTDQICLIIDNKYLFINAWSPSYWAKSPEMDEFYKKELLRKIDMYKQGRGSGDDTFDSIAEYITMSMMAGGGE